LECNVEHSWDFGGAISERDSGTDCHVIKFEECHVIKFEESSIDYNFTERLKKCYNLLDEVKREGEFNLLH
jgi:hypothetical protein